MKICEAVLVVATIACTTPALAQTAADDDRPRRTRIILGPQLVPDYPGASGMVPRPFIDVARARGTDQFRFEAPDESVGIALIREDRFTFGPSLGFEGRRTRRDSDGRLPSVGFTVEAGGFAQYMLTPDWRLRAEARHGIGGHAGFVANLSADYVARDNDRWLFSIGPRATVSDGRYQRAYFGVAAADAPAAGLPAYRPSGGLQALGVTAGALYQLTPRWGVAGYAKYDRLVDDAGRSPVVRAIGSRDQYSAGLAISYTFGRAID